MLRSAAFMVQRYLLGRQTLLVQVPEFDLELRVPSQDRAGGRLYRGGMHAPEVAQFILTRLELEAGELVFDVGASIGWYSMLLARVAPRGATIHAFEPDPWIHGLLKENASRNRAAAVTVVGAAVGEVSGPAMLHRYGYRRRGAARFLPAGRAEALAIDMVSLDDYCRQHRLDKQPVGLIKLGVEGLEYRALRGARQTLQRCRALITDFAPARLEESGAHPAGLLDLLVEFGFRPAELTARGPRVVDRAALIGESRPRNLYWTRPQSPPRAPDPDPDTLAI